MAMNYDTLSQAIKRADQRARKHNQVYYVVLSDTPEVDGTYAVASDYDMDTWFQGMSDNHILYCSAD